jgi:hypothetical protein
MYPELAYYHRNKAKIAKKRKTPEYRKKVNERAKAKRKTDPDFAKKRREYERQWYQKNKKKILKAKSKRVKTPTFRIKNAKQKKLLYKTDKKYRITTVLRSQLYWLIKYYKGIKHVSILELVGCTREHLLKHIESQFKDGMSWENAGQWHIDHIIPCSSFNLENLEDQKKCFHYTNLQPLWAVDNIRKHNKY